MQKLTMEELEKKYIVGEVKPFDQKNEMFKRIRWQSEHRQMFRDIWGGVYPPKKKSGYTQVDRALESAGWYIENAHAQGNIHENMGLYEWEEKLGAQFRQLPPDLKYKIKDRDEMSIIVKNIARFGGADLVGICEIDKRWIYTDSFSMRTRESNPIKLPDGMKYAVAIAVDMNYDMLQTSPTAIAGGGTGMGYSRQAVAASILAGFIRSLGYKAIPSGNDTGLSIPIAIWAGLGELGRHGTMITPKYGPRVRLSKVFTDMPLVPDTPIEFGVTEFCNKCKKCAEYCPGQAIMHGDRTPDPVNISTSPGVLKWPINAEKCLGYWAKNGGACGNCIRVCPFSKTDGILHDSVRWFVEHTPWMDSFFVWFDDLFGYHKQLSPEDFWKKFSKPDYFDKNH